MILTVTLNAAIDKRYVVEGFRSGAVNRVKECVSTPGGKGLNVSKSAAIAGASVTATGFLGGHAGAYIEAALSPFGIETAFYHINQESRSCINIWDEVNQEQTEFLEPGFTVSESEFKGFMAQYKELVKEADVTVLSGSVPKGLPGSTYQELITIANKAGKKVILDTSGQLLTDGVLAKPTMIKPNIDEIRMLTGGDCGSLEDIIGEVERIHRGGVDFVVVSLGSDGSVAVGDEGTYRAVVPEIEVENTVGCGDAMTAGFALGLSEELPLPDMLRKASAISAAAALRKETGFFRMEDMERLLSQIKITRL